MGKIVEKVLEILQAQAETTVALMNIMLTDRSTSYRRARQLSYWGIKGFKQDWAELYRKRQQFYSTLNKLKREGLIVKKRSGLASLWSISKKGKGRLAELYKRGSAIQLPPPQKYPKKKSSGLIVVSFDIPERERRKRDWLRSHLIALGLSSLQKSVWIGRVGLPQEFLKDLRKYKLLPYIHVFSVNKKGTIAHDG